MNKPSENTTVHIIGAGIAGLACALKLSAEGKSVTLYEASAHAGGRCRSFYDPTLERVIDNGNHLILSANKHVLEYIERCGTGDAFYPPQNHFQFIESATGRNWLYGGFAVPSGFSLAALGSTLKLLLSGNNPRAVVADFFDSDTGFYRDFIEPLCVAALNTHPKHASASLFRHVLLSMLRPANRYYYQVRDNLGDALIEPALAIIQRAGGDIYYRQRLASFDALGGRITTLHFNDSQIDVRENEDVVFAVPPEAAGNLLGIEVPDAANHIVNGHFLYDTSALKQKLVGVIGSPLQWIFIKDGLISTTTSDAQQTTLQGLSQIEMAEALWRDVIASFGLEDAPLPSHRIITEKRATFAATPENQQKRPTAALPYENAVLAGDWLQSPLPATLEGAVSSGFLAATRCLRKR